MKLLKTSRNLMAGLSLTVLLAGCGTATNLTGQPAPAVVQASQETGTITIAEVSKNPGASISVKINSETFKVKNNLDGAVEKKTTDITSYKVYLLSNSNTANYPTTGNPIGDTIAGPFNIAKSGASQTVTFTGLPASTPNAYYVRVEAFDSGAANIVKPDNGGPGWSSVSAGAGIAVSSGAGIVVNAALQVSDPNPLSVSLQLKDGFGAKIEAGVSSTPGSAPTAGGVTAVMF